MSYIERELTEGEQIILLGHVSWWTIVPRHAACSRRPGRGGCRRRDARCARTDVLGDRNFLLVVLVWIVMVARQVLRVWTTEIAITDRRVMSKSGDLRTEVKVTPLDKVNSVNVRQSVFGNMLDYGDIEVTTATAEENDNHRIASLAHTDRFRNTLTEIMQSSIFLLASERMNGAIDLGFTRWPRQCRLVSDN